MYNINLTVLEKHISAPLVLSIVQVTFIYEDHSSLSRSLFDVSIIQNTEVVRIYPTDWIGDSLCLSLELLGCEYRGELFWCKVSGI